MNKLKEESTLGDEQTGMDTASQLRIAQDQQHFAR